MRIAILASDPSLKSTAEALAIQLKLPLAQNQHDPYDYFLVLTLDGLALQKAGNPLGALCIDFLRGKMSYRALRTSMKNEALAKAMGLKGNTQPKIIDATGGLAGDSFILAALGFEVTLLERSPIIVALVADAIRRAQFNEYTAPIVNRMHLIHTDAIHWLQTIQPTNRPDIIYLDPMFPERKKSALPKQEMLILHDIVGEDLDSAALLKAALVCALKRVVVKRPRLAEMIAIDVAPSFSRSGSSSRFDVYLC